MKFIKSPWGLVTIALCIVALLYLVIRFWNNSKKEIIYFDILRPEDIFPTIRNPPKLNDQQEPESGKDNDQLKGEMPIER